MIDKFRAYDKVTKRILVDGFAILGETTCFGLIEQALWETPSDKATLERLNEVEIVQSTGLQDKNNVDIYEGDILHELDLIDGNVINKFHPVELSEVELGGDSWGLKYKATCFNVQYEDKSGYISLSESEGDTYAQNTRECIVVGNIHQHPSLLTQ